MRGEFSMVPSLGALIAALLAMGGASYAASPGDGFGAPLSAATLSTSRGGYENTNNITNNITAATNNQTQSATNSANAIAGDANSGAASISGNAMSNLAGMNNVVINTGNQANVQGAMSLLLILH